MTKKKIVKTLPIDPYNQECTVVINGQFIDAYNEIKKHKTQNAKEVIDFVDKENLISKAQKGEEVYFEILDKNYDKLYTKLPHGYVMVINQKEGWIQTVNSVAHESQHLAHYILMRAGITLREESEEAFTYLTSNIIERVLLLIYPYWKPKRKKLSFYTKK